MISELIHESRFGDELPTAATDPPDDSQSPFYYSLTGIPDGSLFEDRFRQAMAQAQRSGNRVGLLLLSLGGVNRITETLGSQVSTRLLEAARERLHGTTRSTDTVARSCNCFAIVLSELRKSDDATLVARKTLRAMNRPFQIDGRTLSPSVSIGVCVYPDDGTEIAELTHQAGLAMNKARAQGGDGYLFKSSASQISLEQLLSIQYGFSQAITGGEFVPYFQPLVELATGEIVALEALVRWQHPELGLIPAANFVQAAEETGVLATIGSQILESACEQVKSWHSSGFTHLKLAVNLSARQFRERELSQQISDALRASGLEPTSLCLEVAESSVLQDLETTVAVFGGFKDMGVQLSVDDFGTADASLKSLKRLPLDILKVDRSFVHGLPNNADQCDMTSTIVGAGHGLGLKVVAEGIENVAQVDFLRSLHCDQLQGFYFSRPLDADGLTKLLESGTRLSGNSIQKGPFTADRNRRR